MQSNIIELGKKFRDLKHAYEAKEAELKKLNEEWTEVDSQLQEALIEEGVNSIDIDGVGKIMIRTQNYLSVNAENKPKFFEYLKQSGNDGILKLDINPRTLTAWLKSHMEELTAKAEEAGLDKIEARNKSLAFLNEQGANYFTKRDIALKEE